MQRCLHAGPLRTTGRKSWAAAFRWKRTTGGGFENAVTFSMLVASSAA